MPADTLGARETLRLQEVYNTFVRYGLDVILDRGVVGNVRRPLQYWLHGIPGPAERLSTPAKARLLLEELGPTYVKVGQLVSSQSQVLPEEWEEELARLQQDVRPFPYEQVREVIESELGKPPEELFDTFDPVPLGAASLAQVHRASLDGAQLVVKVQRPGVRRQVIADLRIMRNLTRFFEGRATWAHEVGLAGIVDEFGRNVVAELDYYGEAYNARRLARNLAGIPGVRIPSVLGSLSSSRVMTMEYVRGVKITDVAAIREHGFEPSALSATLLRAAVKQLLVDGLFHGDPHPGNVLVDLETGQIAFIDCGMVGELTLEQRFNLVNLMLVGRQHDVKGLAQAMRSLSTPFRRVDERRYQRDFERRVGRFVDPESTAPFAGAIAEGFDVLRDNGLRLDPELTLALKALAQAEVITSTLRPQKGGLVEEGYELVQELVAEQITAENVRRVAGEQAAALLREAATHAPKLQQATRKWIQQYEEGRISIHLDTTDLNRQLASMQRLGRQALVAMVIVGLLVGSGVAARVAAQDEEWSFVSRLSYVCFVAAVIGAIAFLWIVLRQIARGGRDDDR
jgi:ubiquinone biosynthesis protein